MENLLGKWFVRLHLNNVKLALITGDLTTIILQKDKPIAYIMRVKVEITCKLRSIACDMFNSNTMVYYVWSTRCHKHRVCQGMPGISNGIIIDSFCPPHEKSALIYVICIFAWWKRNFCEANNDNEDDNFHILSVSLYIRYTDIWCVSVSGGRPPSIEASGLKYLPDLSPLSFTMDTARRMNNDSKN